MVLQVENLDLRIATPRGELHALRGVTFSIGRGEIVGVIGESGAGKSLTGAAITGLVEPPGYIAGGRILLDGVRIDNLPAARMRLIRGRKIASIFQDPLNALNPVLTVGRQLIETIRTHLPLTPAQARQRATEWLEEVNIASPCERMDAYPHELSGGMRQRVVIALALCSEPAVVIADEPTTALDVSIQAQVLQLLKRLCTAHETALMLVTHDMGVVAEIADRVAVMYAGRIVEMGSVKDVIEGPRHPYTIGLMRSIPSLESRQRRLNQIEGTMPRLNELIRGCSFRPRCPRALERCGLEEPELVQSGSLTVACWLAASDADERKITAGATP
jgi:peptide/nickel transport system ATP-binding protein